MSTAMDIWRLQANVPENAPLWMQHWFRDATAILERVLEEDSHECPPCEHDCLPMLEHDPLVIDIKSRLDKVEAQVDATLQSLSRYFRGLIQGLGEIRFDRRPTGRHAAPETPVETVTTDKV